MRLPRAGVGRTGYGRPTAPAADQAGVEIVEVEHAPDRVVHHVIERGWPIVEGGYRREDDGTVRGSLCHGTEVPGVEGRLAEHENHPATLLQADIFRQTSAARVSRPSVLPVAMADRLLAEQGATIMPMVRNEPEVMAAPMSASP